MGLVFVLKYKERKLDSNQDLEITFYKNKYFLSLSVQDKTFMDLKEVLNTKKINEVEVDLYQQVCYQDYLILANFYKI